MSPILMLNIEWMNNYRGDLRERPPHRKGEVVNELYNFLPYRGRCYGYAPLGKSGAIKTRRLISSSGGDDVSGVLVIWTAPRPDGGGRYVVGWYRNATVLAHWQVRPQDPRARAVQDIYFCVSAAAQDCHLVATERRVFVIPTVTKGFPGRAASFFPDESSPKTWVHNLRRYVGHGVVEATPKPQIQKTRRAVDVDSKGRVEISAVKTVVSHFCNLGFSVTSRENEKVGWDLDARAGSVFLRLEVKGLSGNKSVVEVTPKEYEAMQKFRSSYRVCIVTEALSAKPKLKICSYDKRYDSWVGPDLQRMNVDERVAARLSLNE